MKSLSKKAEKLELKSLDLHFSPVSSDQLPRMQLESQAKEGSSRGWVGEAGRAGGREGRESAPKMKKERIEKEGRDGAGNRRRQQERETGFGTSMRDAMWKLLFELVFNWFISVIQSQFDLIQTSDV